MTSKVEVVLPVDPRHVSVDTLHPAGKDVGPERTASRDSATVSLQRKGRRRLEGPVLSLQDLSV